MKKIIISISLVCILLFTTLSVIGVPIQELNKRSFHRGIFHAELGLRNNTIPISELDGSYRDFRGKHLLSGSISLLNSDRSIHFQGIITRNMFIIQTGYRNHIINIIGKFVSYDEEDDEYHGIWRGFCLGYRQTSGWITVELND